MINNIPDGFYIAFQTDPNQPLEKNKYQFFCENHDNIFAMQKVARYIEKNFQVGDIILIEGELAGREIPQEKSLVKTIKFISKKVRVMGWDNYQYSKCLDLQSDNPNPVAQMNIRTLDLNDLQKEICSDFEEFIDDTSNLLEMPSAFKKYVNEEFSDDQKFALEELGLFFTDDCLIENLIITFLGLKEISPLEYEEGLNIFLGYWEKILIQTKRKLIEFNDLIYLEEKNSQESPKKIKLILTIQKNFSQLSFLSDSAIAIYNEGINNFFKKAHRINRWIGDVADFPERVSSMMNTLNMVSTTTNHIFVIAGKAHFIDKKHHKEEDLTDFYAWMKDKPCAIFDPYCETVFE